MSHEASFDRIVPPEFLPPSHWEIDPAKLDPSEKFKCSSSSSDTLSNGAAVPSHEVYYLRKRELLYHNDDAYNAIGRQPGNTSNRAAAKVVHFRKFFESLHVAGMFWDTSKDNFPLPVTSKLQPEGDDNNAMDIDQALPLEPIQVNSRQDDKNVVDGQTSSLLTEQERLRNDKMDNGEASSPEIKQDNPQEEDNNQDIGRTDTKLKSTGKADAEYTYTGRRTSTGTSMPDSYLDELVRNFVEPIAWCFGCRANIPHVNPRLQLQNLLIPVRHSSVVYRAPKDRLRARAGILEGPLVGVHCRTEPPTALNKLRETTMRDLARKLEEGSIDQARFNVLADECERKNDESGVSDLLREVGAMLLLSQEREREGREEIIVGKQKWWAEKARWGGGSGGEKGADDEQKPSIDRIRRDKKRKTKAIEVWKGLQGPASRWDKMVMYSHVGKSPSEAHDHVSISFLSFSSIFFFLRCIQ